MIEINEEKKVIINTFINSLIENLKAKNVLILNHSQFNIFNSIVCEKKKVLNYSESINVSEKWDLILADLPIGMKVEFDGKSSSYITKTILESINLLNESGLMFSIGENILIQNTKRGIRSLLNNQAELLAIIDSPEGLFKPYTNLRIPFFLVKKGLIAQEIICELKDQDQADHLAKKIVNESLGNNLEEGIFIKPGEFQGFSRWKIHQHIQALETEYKQFGTKKLSDLFRSINSVKPKSNFDNLSNSLYIHKVGTKPVTSNIENLSSNHSNFYQCVCNHELVDAKYLESFFCSRLGKLILNSLNSGSFIPNITLQNLNDAEVSIPPLKEQLEIINSISKLKKVKDVISQFEDDLAVNPISSDTTLKQIDIMLEVVGGLADSDKVMSLIRSGESKQTEFKETLTLDVKKQSREKYIELSVVKTIAAFMNSSGGTLVIGVNDSGEISGVDYEVAKFYKTHDDYLLKFRNLIKERIGGQVYDFIDYRLIKIFNKHVLLVECKESPIPIYVDDNDFYVRTNPATDKLDGPKMVTYITNHFSKKSQSL
ncbi:RNA-binding domain-containing protein [Polynucleobacter sp. HIN5]|uniref:RNA-binding domain-containing protein n=1 Tax=Polynucleobacter sp. HIN5 TaxID=3047864 RepID=UPI002572F6A1|nr:RNA-binding domain-containing protein [Polynucleobacter sp. HIN5]BEI33218.1 hypothetical protein PHIN5_05860 [Polynucleobacter sp. HIN5]